MPPNQTGLSPAGGRVADGIPVHFCIGEFIFCIIEFALDLIRGRHYLSGVPSHQGALRNVINAGRDAVDADGVSDEGT
jgi:hypothetical protein